MEATPDKRQRARELADEYLGRAAPIARAAVAPLGVAGRLALAAGLVIWAAGPAPIWQGAPNTALSLLLLVILLAPGLRLLRHRRRVQAVIANLPDLLDDFTGAIRGATVGISGLPEHWRESSAPEKSGAFATGRRCYKFYRQDLAPLRSGPGRVVGEVTDALAAFSGPALILSGIALLAALAEVVLSPITVIIRLIN